MHKKIAVAFSIYAFGCAVHAQSNVTVFGVVDVAYLSARAAGNGNISSLNADGNSSSRLGFRGEEDLGGGLKASFWLEAGLSPDSGIGGNSSLDNKALLNSNGGLTLARRSTVSLHGGFGELRLGRDYTPTFINLTTAIHPFGTNGIGNSGQLFFPVAAGGTTPRTNSRASNALNYFTPEIGGFSANLMYAMGEQPSLPATTRNDGNYLGGRISYRNGPFTFAISTGKTNYATGDYTQSNWGAVYQVTPATRVSFLSGENKVGVTRTRANMIGATHQIGPAGELRAAFTQVKASGVANDATQITLGYVHSLSKRTVIYTNYSVVDNKGTGKQFVVGGGGAVPAVLTPGGNSTGFELGVRHNF